MIVIPFSRSRSIESITRSATDSLARKTPLCQSIASTRVVFPWSTWAMMAKLRSPVTGSARSSWRGKRSGTGAAADEAQGFPHARHLGRLEVGLVAALADPGGERALQPVALADDAHRRL